MAKQRSHFVCQECGSVSPKWLGRCPDCGKWNSLVEEFEANVSSQNRGLTTAYNASSSKPLLISEITATEAERLKTGIEEFDRVLGGGVVKGSLVLIGGEPGIGKSTLLLQVADRLSSSNGKTLYVSGEESAAQTKLRANRLSINSNQLYILCETNLETIESQVEKFEPKAVIIDSIQTCYRSDLESAPGSVSQVRECATELMRLAKTREISIFIVGHVTKDGTIAGPRVLEHIVDTVLYFDGEQRHLYRVLRAFKNRFGSTNEIGIFEMRNNGLQQVENPSEIFLSERRADVSGSVVVSSIEGSRPLLLELQALVTPSGFGTPSRMTTGVDRNRLSLLLAVLEKRAGIRTQNYDVFVNVVGGVQIDEPAIDLGIIVAVASNIKNIALDAHTVVMGEVGLGGEVRAVNQVEKRLKEATKLGFKRAVISEQNFKGLESDLQIQLLGVRDIRGALGLLL